MMFFYSVLFVISLILVQIGYQHMEKTKEIPSAENILWKGFGAIIYFMIGIAMGFISIVHLFILLISS